MKKSGIAPTPALRRGDLGAIGNLAAGNSEQAELELAHVVVHPPREGPDEAHAKHVEAVGA